MIVLFSGDSKDLRKTVHQKIKALKWALFEGLGARTPSIFLINFSMILRGLDYWSRLFLKTGCNELGSFWQNEGFEINYISGAKGCGPLVFF
jgi:hypothetical protein